LQSVVLETLSSIDLSVPGSASLVMRDLSEYATLPFIAAFDVKKKKKKGAYPEMQKRVTYIGISKKTMPMLVELLMRFHQCCPEIYVDGTLEAVFGVCISLCFFQCFLWTDTYMHTGRHMRFL